MLGALCGCEAVTFHRTAAELDLHYESLDFEAAFTIDIRGRQGDRSVRPHFQTVRVRAVVATAEPVLRGRAVFTSPREVSVDGRGLPARAFAVATGSQPSVPPVPGLSETGYLTNPSLRDLL